MSLRTTIVGCGAVAQRLYRKPLQMLQREGHLRVTGLVDSHVGHAEKLRSFFPRAAIYQDLDRALSDCESDLTLILTPAHLHAEQAILALRHRNHVLCEKPMATTETDCVKMTAMAREAGRVLAIGMIRRFFPSYTCLKQLIDARAIGNVLEFSYREGRKFDWDVTTPSAFVRKKEGGAGILFDIGSHVLDLLIWLFGVPRVASYSDDALTGGVESNVVMELEFPCCSGLVQLSWDCTLENELRVLGCRGEVVVKVDQFDKVALKADSRFQEIALDCVYPADVRQPSRRTLGPRLYTQSMYCQLIQLIRAIELGESPAVSGEAGKDCVGAIESALRLAVPIDMPWLSQEQQDAFRSTHWSNA